MHSTSQITEPIALTAPSKFANEDYLATICHEIRSPLNAIIGLSNILAHPDCSPEKRVQCTRVLRDSSDMLMELLNDMLDTTKLENGKLKIEHIPFDLRKVAEEAMNIMALKAEEKNLDFNSHICADLPASFIGDPLRIRQILLNLLSNAVKFTDAGFVSLNVEVKADSHRHCEIFITVSDSGIGIEKEKLGRIFDKYMQIATSRKYGGTGLGLPISRELAHLMHGDISVKSEPGAGTRFIVTLPLLKTPLTVAEHSRIRQTALLATCEETKSAALPACA